MHSPQLNWLLAQLPEDDYERLSPHLELVGLETGKQLFHTGQQHTDIFFPTTCTVSAQIELETGNFLMANEYMTNSGRYLTQEELNMADPKKYARWFKPRLFTETGSCRFKGRN